MNFYDNLRAARMSMGLTQKTLSEMIDVSPVTIGNWERGKKYPSFEGLVKLASALETSTDALLGRCGEENLTVEEKRLISKYRALDIYGKKIVNSLCDFELERIEDQDKPFEFSSESKRYLPYYSAPSAAGFAAPLEGEDFEMLLVTDKVPADADFAVKISGDSMEPYIHDGQMVFVRECERLKKGEVGIFCVDGAMYCKQYVPMDDKLCLYSANPERQEANVYITNDSSSFVKCCGKVLLVDDIPMPEL